MHKRGKLIVVEAIDGAGKDTQIKAIMEYISSLGIEVVQKSNISDGPVGVAIREVLSDNKYHISDKQISALFISELHTVIYDIEEYLALGTWVVCSRFFYSTLAYAGTTEEDFNYINNMCVFDIYPDIVLYLDVDPEIAYKRIISRGGKLEIYEEVEKLIAIKNRFYQALAIASKNSKVITVSANDSIEVVSDNIRLSLLVAINE